MVVRWAAACVLYARRLDWHQQCTHARTHSVRSRVWSVMRRASPKSVILRSQLELTRMLDGFRSLRALLSVCGLFACGGHRSCRPAQAQTPAGRQAGSAPVDDADGVDVLDAAEELVKEELDVLGAERPPVVDGPVQVHVHQLPHLTREWKGRTRGSVVTALRSSTQAGPSRRTHHVHVVEVGVRGREHVNHLQRKKENAEGE